MRISAVASGLVSLSLSTVTNAFVQPRSVIVVQQPLAIKTSLISSSSAAKSPFKTTQHNDVMNYSSKTTARQASAVPYPLDGTW